MINLGVAGVLGRMGKTIASMALRDKALNLTLVTERDEHEHLGSQLHSQLNQSSNNVALMVQSALHADYQGIDVLIDFTTPEATMQHLNFALEHKFAMVVGTTGCSKAEIAKIKTASQKIPICMAPNMSLGANLLFALAKKTASLLGDEYDIEIVESHHRYKKDAPSGTAKRLAESITEAKGWSLDKVGVYGRVGMTGERPTKQIGIHVIRAGDIVGDHTASFNGPGEAIQLSHHASSRDAFASGAIAASKFLSTQKKGLYDMSHVLGLDT